MSWQMAIVAVFFIIAAYTDVKEKKIKNRTTSLLAIVSLLLFVVPPLIQGNWQLAGFHILGGLLAFLVLLIPAAYLMVNMGGDIKFAGAAGIALGGMTAVSWVLVASTLVIIVGTYNVKRKGTTYWDTIPFAPFFFISLLGHLAISFIF